MKNKNTNTEKNRQFFLALAGFIIGIFPVFIPNFPVDKIIYFPFSIILAIAGYQLGRSQVKNSKIEFSKYQYDCTNVSKTNSSIPSKIESPKAHLNYEIKQKNILEEEGTFRITYYDKLLVEANMLYEFEERTKPSELAKIDYFLDEEYRLENEIYEFSSYEESMRKAFEEIDEFEDRYEDVYDEYTTKAGKWKEYMWKGAWAWHELEKRKNVYNPAFNIDMAFKDDAWFRAELKRSQMEDLWNTLPLMPEDYYDPYWGKVNLANILKEMDKRADISRLNHIFPPLCKVKLPHGDIYQVSGYKVDSFANRLVEVRLRKKTLYFRPCFLTRISNSEEDLKYFNPDTDCTFEF